MAMTYQNFASLGVNLNRQKYGPLDISNVFTSEADLKYYLSKGTFTTGVSEYWYKDKDNKVVPYPYEGQVLATVIDGVVSVYALSLDAEGNFQTQEIGAKIETDDKTIKLVDGKLELVGIPEVTAGKTFVPSLVNGVLTWAEPDTSTAEGQQQAIDGLTTRMTAVEATVNGKPESSEGAGDAVVGLVEKVAALEAVDNATQAELDAYKEVVTGAIADALQAAKDYADENDANTVYDDTALQNRVKAIEDDYLTEADKYDDTALAGRVTTAEGKIVALEDEVNGKPAVGEEGSEDYQPAVKGLRTLITDETARAEAAEIALGERIDAIDFIDGDELDSAIADAIEEANSYTDGKIAEVNEAIGKLNHFTTKIVTSTDDVTEEGILYLIKDESVAGVDKYNEYLFVGGEAVLIGDTTTDLSNYYTKSEVESEFEAVEKLIADETTARKALSDEVDALKAVDNATQAELDAYKLEVTQAIADAKQAAIDNADGKLANKLDTATFTEFQGTNATAIENAQNAAIAAAKTETETQVGALEDAVAETYATKDALNEAVEGIENDLLGYVTNDTFTTELAKKADASAVYTKGEVDAKIGTPGVPAVTDEEGNEITPAVQGTGVFANAYSRAEVDKLLDEVQGGSSASADSVLRQLNTYKSTNDERVSNIETKNGEQDTAIATAQAQADKGVADAAKVAGDLTTLGVTVADNTREIGVAKSSIETVNTTLSGKITALEGKDTTIESNITALQGTVGGHTTTIAEQGTKISALENKDLELAALIQGNTDKFGNYYTSTQVDAKVKEVADAVGAIDLTPYAKSADVDAAIGGLNTALTNGLATKVNTSDFDTYKTETATLIGTKADASALASYYTKTEADAEFMTESEVDARIDALIAASDPDGDGNVITNIQNLVEYVENNAGEIAGLVTTVNGHTTTLGEHATAIAANKSAHEANASAIGALQATVGEHTTAIAKNAEDIGKINTAIAGIVQPKASTEVTVAEDGTLGLGEVSTDKLVMGADTLVIDGGTAL